MRSEQSEIRKVEGIPHPVHVMYHRDLKEYEAFIPDLDGYLFTAAGPSEQSALDSLKHTYPSLKVWWDNMNRISQ